MTNEIFIIGAGSAGVIVLSPSIKHTLPKLYLSILLPTSSLTHEYGRSKAKGRKG